MKTRRIVRSHWMAAACAAAGMLAGCDASTDPNHAARKASAQAAHQVAGAGDLKATEKLVERVAGGNISPLTPAEFKESLKNPGADSDLTQVTKKLTESINAGSLDPGLKSALESQLGAAQLELSFVRYAELQDDIEDVTQKAIALQAVAQGAFELGTQADTLDQGAQQAATNVDNLKAASEKAAAEVKTREDALAQAQQKVKSVQDQISSKDTEARKIYADTEAAFNAAGTLKGNASITAANKAMEDRKAAEKLMEEMGNLDPDLRQAQAELAMAQVRLGDAQNLAKAAATSYNNGVEAAAKTSQRGKDLRASATKIVNDPEIGVKARLTAFTTAYAALDAKIKAALTAADQASTSYSAASKDYTDARQAAKQFLDDRQITDTTDPLARFSKDDRMPAILAWSRSAAAQQGGRVSLAGMEIQGIAKTAVGVAGAAMKAAKESSDAKISETSYAADALTRFTNAVSAIASTNSIPAPAGGDMANIKWIGYSLEASANAGLYRVAAERDKGTVLAAAKTAQGKATSANPALQGQLSWVADIK